MNNTISQPELFDIAKVGQKMRLIKWMNENSIPYKLAANGDVFTTTSLLDASFANPDNENIVFGHGKK